MRHKKLPTIPKYLVIRNNVFYYRKGSKRISLQTKDFGTAMIKLVDIDQPFISKTIEIYGQKIELFYKDSSYSEVLIMPSNAEFIRSFYSLYAITTPEQLQEYIPNLSKISVFINESRQAAISAITRAFFILDSLTPYIKDKPQHLVNNLAFVLKGLMLQKENITIEEFISLKTYDPDYKEDLVKCIRDNSDNFKANIKNIPDSILKKFDIHEADIKTTLEINQDKTNKILELLNQISTTNSTNNGLPIKEKPHRTIDEILNMMFAHNGVNNEKQKSRTKSHINLELQLIGLSLNSDYLDFNTESNIQKISYHIAKILKLGDSTRADHMGSVRRLIEYANKLDPDYYKSNTLALLHNIKKTTTNKIKGYLPFTEEQITSIFELTKVNKDFYTKHPEIFISMLIALYTGSRGSACASLTFGDIFKEPIPYLKFINDSPQKKLKTIASQRSVPIAEQLLSKDFNIINLIQDRKKSKKLTDKDTIFPQMITMKSNTDSFFKPFHRFLKKYLNINDNEEGKWTFHSFRDTVSNKLKSLGIEETKILSIVGWSGNNTMKKTYSKHFITELKPEVDKIKYDNLNLAEWYPIIKSAYLKLPTIQKN